MIGLMTDPVMSDKSKLVTHLRPEHRLSCFLEPPPDLKHKRQHSTGQILSINHSLTARAGTKLIQTEHILLICSLFTT